MDVGEVRADPNPSGEFQPLFTGVLVVPGSEGSHTSCHVVARITVYMYRHVVLRGGISDRICPVVNAG